MAQKPDGKAAKTERVTFTMDSAQRIGKVVRAVEAGSRDCAGLSFGRAPDSPGFKLQLATFTGTWASATYKTVTLSGSTQTASVYNWCNTVDDTGDGTAQKHVIFGNIKGTASAVELPVTGFQLKLATFTGAWATGTFKTVTLSGSTQTASVYNWCNPVEGSTASTAQKYVIFGNVRGTASAIELPFSSPIRIGKTGSAWNKGNPANIAVWEGGTPPSETANGDVLYGCENKFANVAADKWVALGRAGNGTYYLIAAECS